MDSNTNSCDQSGQWEMVYSREQSCTKPTRKPTLERIKPKHSCFEWIQVLSAVAVPIAIGIFTLLNSYQQMNFAKQQHQTAIDNRESDLTIAKDARDADIVLASENRRLDNEMAHDQRREDTLVEYMAFLSEALFNYGLQLNGSQVASLLVRIKTLAALKQLDPIRKHLVFKALFESSLIVSKDAVRTNPIVDLSTGDLKYIEFGGYKRGAQETYVTIDGLSIMDADFGFSLFEYINIRSCRFTQSSMSNTRFYKARATQIDFTQTYFENSTIQNSEIIETTFRPTFFTSLSCILHTTLDGNFSGSLFQDVTLNFTKLQGDFYGVRFIKSNLSSVQFISSNITRSLLYDLEMVFVDFTSCSFTQSSVTFGSWINFRSVNTEYSESVITNLSLHNTSILGYQRQLFDRMNFTNVNFFGTTIISTTTFSNSYFDHCQLMNVSFIFGNLIQVTISNSKLDGIRWRNVILTNSTLLQTSFTEGFLLSCYFSSVTIENSNFSFANLTGTRMIDSRSINTTFSAAILQNLNLTNGYFSEVNFSFADFRGALLNGTIFDRVNFVGAKINDVQLSSASSLRGSILPNGTIVES